MNLTNLDNPSKQIENKSFNINYGKNIIKEYYTKNR